jgi:hypothetical protein
MFIDQGKPIFPETAELVGLCEKVGAHIAGRGLAKQARNRAAEYAPFRWAIEGLGFNAALALVADAARRADIGND